jgi:hypothetical protein
VGVLIGVAGLAVLGIWPARPPEVIGHPLDRLPAPVTVTWPDPVPAWLADARDAGTAPFDDHAVDLAVAVLVGHDGDPENQAGFTTRFTTPTVTMWVDDVFRTNHDLGANLAFAITWVEGVTGVTFAEVTDRDAAQIRVVEHDTPGGNMKNRFDRRTGVVWQADVRIGCCLPAVAVEELGHAMGAGDGADQRSMFSVGTEVLPEPFEFDAWVLRTLYQLPPGTSEAGVRAALTATADGT